MDLFAGYRASHQGGQVKITRLTPIVPGEMQPFVFVDGKVHTGFITGGRTEGRGFPQWAMPIFSSRKVHYFGEPVSDDVVVSLCDRVVKHKEETLMPGNYPRCKDCEKRLSKLIRRQQAVIHPGEE